MTYGNHKLGSVVFLVLLEVSCRVESRCAALRPLYELSESLDAPPGRPL